LTNRSITSTLHPYNPKQPRSLFITLLEAIPHSHIPRPLKLARESSWLPDRQKPVFFPNSKERRKGMEALQVLLPSAIHRPISSMKITDIS
jgi:hypothetical protein